MPKPKKKSATTADRLREAEKLLEGAKFTVLKLEQWVSDLRCQVYADLAAMGRPLERPDDFLDLGVVQPESPLFDAQPPHGKKFA